MPSLPPAPHYQAAPPTKVDLDYVDLPIIDLSKFESAENRAPLAAQVQHALLTHGFFYVVGHGRKRRRKAKYAGAMKQTGSYQGYKPRGYWHIDNGVRDQLEHYNMNRDVTKRTHPEALRPFLPEIKEFAKFNHFNVLHPILRLIALSLELPEDALVNVHNYDAVGETYVRFMKYYPRSAEEEVKTNNLWLKGHTGESEVGLRWNSHSAHLDTVDFGSLTILWSQPVAALQILSKDGRWQWVKHIENALVVNAWRCPPPDQQQYTRLGVFYFIQPDDNVRLIIMRESPLLQRVGINPRCEDNVAPTTEQWRKARTSAYGQSDLKQGKENGVEEEIINGVVVKHWK
ncbi:hypothetical protein JVU11DRAFT_6134 [Chiua virens]|nr:hypothetical protein JVU11DRAFT_6134 [Chiua virens]